jgi:hypothetical protein
MEVVESKALTGSFYDVFLDEHEGHKFLLLFGDNLIKIFEVKTE